ncbi:MAG: DNA repair protein RecO [Candidatus Moranbacteria bacterium]|nr:DNA repair protein RecO [Candidatus Moranbacteria bacterium]
MNSHFYISCGFVMAKYSSRETDSVYQIFTRDYGRLLLFAKSARKPKAKLSGHLEPGSLSRVYFISSQKKNQYLLIGAVNIFKPEFQFFSHQQFIMFNQALSLLKQFCAYDYLEADQIKQFYQLGRNFLHRLNQLSQKPNKLFLLQAHFLFKLLRYSGLAPNLKACQNCSEALKNKSLVFYAPQAGGLLCGNCAQAGAIKLSGQAVSLADFLLNQNFGKIKKSNFQPEQLNQAWDLAKAHVKYCLD